MEKVPSGQGSQGDDIRAMALAGEEQRLQEGQYGLQEVRGCGVRQAAVAMLPGTALLKPC